MKHIGVFLDFEPNGGGTFQYAHTLVKHLCSLPNTRVTVVYTQGNWAGIFEKDPVHLVQAQSASLLNKVLWKILRTHLIPQFVWNLVAKYLPLRKLLDKQRADFWFFPCQDYWSFFLGIKNGIVSIHDLMHRYERRFEEVGSQYYSREFLYKNILKVARYILVDSELGKKQVIESYGYNPENIFVLPYTVPSYVHDVALRPKNLLFDEGSFYFYPAQFWSHKNHLRLLQALVSTRNRGYDFKLVLVGGKKNAGEKIESFISANQLENVVQCLGYVSDAEVVWLHKHSMGLVMPTFFGPTNIPPLEAMALGVPMAVSGIYAMQEQSGRSALYFNPNSVDEIAECLIKLSQIEVRKQLIEASVEQLPKVSEQNFRNRLQELISQL